MNVCPICEVMPVDEVDDPLCPVCRIEFTAASQIVRDPVEQLLSRHQRLMTTEFVMCLCGEPFEGPALYRRHVAELIRTALGLDPPAPWTPASDEIEQ